MAVAEKPPVADALTGLPMEISPELLAQAIQLIQQRQAPGPVGLPAWTGDAGAPILDEVLAPDGVGDQMFYRQSNGWITSGPIGKAKSRMHAYKDQGWTPLEEYGQFDLTDYYSSAPLEVLLIRGGAKEMPVEQVMALGWHLHPPKLPRCGVQVGAEHKARVRRPRHYEVCWKGARPAVFPQLAGRTFVKPDKCEFCERDDFASDQVRNQHTRVAHKEEEKTIGAAREMAKSVGTVMGAAAAVGKGTSLPVRLPYVCGICDEDFERPKALTDHVKLHAENVDTDDSGATA